MKAESYLSKDGQVIFKKIETFIKDNNVMKDIDSYRLSQLAFFFEQFGQAANACNGEGKYQEANSGYKQISPEWTILKTANEQIEKLGSKFGLTPMDREKISAFVKEKHDTRTREGKMKALVQ